MLKNWTTFFYSIMTPNAVIPLMAGTIITALSFFIDSPLLSRLMYLTGAILFTFGSSGVKNNYQKTMHDSILLQKGKSAARNLQAVSSQCKKISAAANKISSQKKINKNQYKELSRNIESISVRISSGIEDWQDLVPELKGKPAPKKHSGRKTKTCPSFDNGLVPAATLCSYYPPAQNSNLCQNCPARKVIES